MKKSPSIILASVLALLLAALACGPRDTETPTAGQQAGTEDTSGATQSPVPGATDTLPSPSDTPVPDVTAEGGCTLNASWVADLTVPDNTEFPPGAAFIKTWRVRNSGTCDWEAGTKLVFISGDPLGGPVSVTVGAVTAGSNTDVSVNLVAPSAPGTYKGNWQMEDADGVRFGSAIYVQIVVPAPATATPTKTPTPEPTATGGCVLPDPLLKPVLDHAEALGYDMGCPTGPAFNVQHNGDTGAFQEFWANVTDPNPHTHYRSLMIWRGDIREIYVIDGVDTDASRGTLLAYTDTWAEGQPDVHPDCAAMVPPAGYQPPVRGFGKAWCTNGLVDEVGWPAAGESQVNLLVQPMQTGLLIRVTGPIPIGYLVALDYQAVEGVTMMISP